MNYLIVFLSFFIIFITPKSIYFRESELRKTFLSNEIKNVELIKEPPELPEKISKATFLFFGDMMFGRNVENLSIQNNNYSFDKIKDFLYNSNSDIIFGNLEGPISNKHIKTKNGSVSFSFPKYSLDVLKENNINLVSLANNHMQDRGKEGFVQTMNNLSEKKISYFGDYYNRDEYLYFSKTINNINILFIGINMINSECEEDIKICELDILDKTKNILNKDEFQNYFSILSIHWGNEYKIKANDIQKSLGHKLIDSGIDLIIGGHPHVTQEMETYNGKLIFYSLGNFIFDQYFSKNTQEGFALEFNLQKEYDYKYDYKILPIKSISSQPNLILDKLEVQNFIEKYNLK